MFHGSMVALVTPFRNGRVDLPALRRLVALHLERGTDALVPVGTTGESPTLSPDEKREVIRTVVKAARGRAPVIAGSGSNDTRATIEATRTVRKLGADAALVVTPYYNRPSQEGLFRHFEAVARAADLPIVMYNVPSRTGVNLLPETVARLSKVRNVAAIKEASGSVEQAAQIHAACGLPVLSGDDALTLPLMAQGAAGVISVAANVVPGPMAELCAAARKGDFGEARAIHLKYVGLMKALFVESNPVPVKAALEMMGLAGGSVRPPLCGLAPASLEKHRSAMKAVNLI